MRTLPEVLNDVVKVLPPSKLKIEVEELVTKFVKLPYYVEKLALTPHETFMMELMLNHKIVPAKMFLKRIKTKGALWVHKRRLEMKLEEHGIGEIMTVHREGYMLRLKEEDNALS